jgi:hypothetical protein
MVNDQHSGEKAVRIRRGKVDSLTLYEITDYELETLAIGSPSSLHLNFAIFFLSLATSFLVALLTTTIESVKAFSVFVVITVIGFSAGAVLLTMWHFSHRSTKSIIRQIRDRIPADQVETVETEGTELKDEGERG